jgi:hypothetical protein
VLAVLSILILNIFRATLRQRKFCSLSWFILSLGQDNANGKEFLFIARTPNFAELKWSSVSKGWLGLDSFYSFSANQCPVFVVLSLCNRNA